MNVKNFVLGIGIIIVYALVLWQGVEAFYPSPDYNDYCGDVRPTAPVETPQACEDLGGQWNYITGTKTSAEDVNGYCYVEYTCNMEYQDAQDRYSKNVFFIALIIGIITFIIGYSVLKVEPVGSALLGSGIWAIFYGSVINWRNFSNIWRFLLLFLALVLLIWIALRLNSNKKSWKFWKK